MLSEDSFFAVLLSPGWESSTLLSTEQLLSLAGIVGGGSFKEDGES